MFSYLVRFTSLKFTSEQGEANLDSDYKVVAPSLALQFTGLIWKLLDTQYFWEIT